MGKKGFYAVARGRTVGVYHTWDDCKAQVDGFSGPRLVAFDEILLDFSSIVIHNLYGCYPYQIQEV